MYKICKILQSDIWFHVFAIVSIFLIVISFFLPPRGVIDNSVFCGVGEIFGFAALWEVSKAIKKGYDTKITHKDTTVEFTDNKDDKK